MGRITRTTITVTTPLTLPVLGALPRILTLITLLLLLLIIPSPLVDRQFFGERALLQEYCEQDVRALARLLILNQIKLPKINAVAPNFVFGIASALAARRASDALRIAASPAEAPSAAPEPEPGNSPEE